MNVQRKPPASRDAAVRSGAKTYLGSPCTHGHAGERYASTGQCVECARQRYRERSSAPGATPETDALPAGRALAKSLGASRYMAEQPCRYGHAPIRYTSNGHCVACALDRSAALRLNQRLASGGLADGTRLRYWIAEREKAQKRLSLCLEQISQIRKGEK
jgi:hypothetical protein